MSFDEFKTMISALSRAHGLGTPRFSNNLDKGRYEARLRTGEFITGSKSKSSITINQPNHRFQVPVADLMRAV